MNDFVRDKFTTEDNTIPLFAEILAGGTVSIELWLRDILLCLIHVFSINSLHSTPA